MTTELPRQAGERSSLAQKSGRNLLKVNQLSDHVPALTQPKNELNRELKPGA